MTSNSVLVELELAEFLIETVIIGTRPRTHSSA